MFEDKKLICRKCGAEFIFSLGEQEFYLERGLKKEPSTCRECRNNKKKITGKLHNAVCTECGKTELVPFIPKEGKAVYCRECFKLVRK